MTIRSFFRAFLLATVVLAGNTSAHPLAPALWAMDEQSPGYFLVTWKTSLKAVPGVALKPVFPEQCRVASAASSHIEGTGRITQWSMRCGASLSEGSHFTVTGLEDSQTGVLFRIQFIDGRSFHRMLDSSISTFVLAAEPNTKTVISNYLRSGIGHLLSGIDHMLFIIALVLLVGWNRRLFWTVTLFTLGHSVTLSLSMLGYVRFPVNLVESLIALSIVMAAVEIIRKDDQRLFNRHPWLMSAGFGLLHGMGFAGALSETGLPGNDIPVALASFNVGIELGQLLVIALLGMAGKAILLIKPHWPDNTLVAPAYSLGIISAFWFWQRTGLEQFLVG